jgi:hypothetical protein
LDEHCLAPGLENQRLKNHGFFGFFKKPKKAKKFWFFVFFGFLVSCHFILCGAVKCV